MDRLDLDSVIFRLSDDLCRPGFVTALYLVQGSYHRIQRRLRAIALEESTGSWLDLPLETKELRERYAARVTGVYPVATASSQVFLAAVCYPIHDFGDNIPLLITYLYGGISALPDVRLIDVRIPTDDAQRVGAGPRFGLEYLRQRTNRLAGPLLMGIVKPCIGLGVREHAEVAAQLALGGCHLIKDDELLVNQEFSPSVERACAIVDRLHKAGPARPLYFANVTERPSRALALGRALKAQGVDGLLVSGYATGLCLLRDLSDELDLPVALHPAVAGALYHAPHAGIDERVVFGRLPWMAGADLVILFGPSGKFRLSPESLDFICQALAPGNASMPRTAPAIAAGVHPGQVHGLVQRFGTDIVIVAGAAIVAHPDGPAAGARAFVQAIDAAVAGVPAREAAGSGRELARALDAWGAEDGPALYDILPD